MSYYLISPQALQDLREIAMFKEQYSAGAAVKLIDKITRQFQTLAKFPNLGRKRNELIIGLQSFPVEDYLIFYSQIKGGIEVVRVISGYRDLEMLFNSSFF